jgi:hypothetical protein
LARWNPVKPGWPGESTRDPTDPGKPGWDPASFFFNMYKGHTTSFWLKGQNNEMNDALNQLGIII